MEMAIPSKDPLPLDKNVAGAKLENTSLNTDVFITVFCFGTAISMTAGYRILELLLVLQKYLVKHRRFYNGFAWEQLFPWRLVIAARTVGL